MKAKKTWVLVADGARAYIVTSEGVGGGLKPAMNYDFAASHAPSQAFGSDRPGRAADKAGGSSHAYEPRIDWHTFEKSRFAKSMAEVLDKAADGKSFDRLVLVAPPVTLGALRKALNAKTRNLVSAELGKDLTHLTIHQLPQHLEKIMVI